MKAQIITLVKYGMVGAVNTLVDYSVSLLCHYIFGLAEIYAQAVGYIFGVVCSYILNGRFTFKTKGNIPKFLIVNGISLAISEIMTHLLESVGIEYAIAKAMTIAVTTIINYVGYKLFAFKAKPEK